MNLFNRLQKRDLVVQGQGLDKYHNLSKLQPLSVLTACEYYHMMSTGSMDLELKHYKGLKLFLEKVLETWDSNTESLYDKTIKTLVEVTLAEKR